MKTDKRITRWKFEFLLLMCSFGCLGPVVRGINLPTAVIVWARALISACALLLFHLIFRKKIGKEILSFLIPMLASGVFLAIDWIGLFASYRYTTIATATLCYYITPVLVLIGAAVFLKERLTARKVICMVVAPLSVVESSRRCLSTAIAAFSSSVSGRAMLMFLGQPPVTRW